MDVLTFYKRQIVENKYIIFISIFISTILRLVLINFTDVQYSSFDGNFLLTSFSLEVFSDKVLSFVFSCLFTAIVMLYAVYLNAKYSLVRTKSYLLYALIILIFSSSSIFIYWNVAYFTLLLFLMSIDVLFSSYQEKNPTKKSYSIGFILGISSLFSVSSLYYFPVFWIGLRMMRNFGIKSFFTSILGVFTIYWLLFCYCLWYDKTTDFIDLFSKIKLGINDTIPSMNHLVYYGVCLIFLLVAILNDKFDSYKDKIRVRAMTSFFNLICIYSLVLISLLKFDQTNNIYLFEFTYAVLMTHFFSLADSKWQVNLFYMFIILIVMRSLYSSFT